MSIAARTVIGVVATVALGGSSLCAPDPAARQLHAEFEEMRSELERGSRRTFKLGVFADMARHLELRSSVLAWFAKERKSSPGNFCLAYYQAEAMWSAERFEEARATFDSLPTHEWETGDSDYKQADGAFIDYLVDRRLLDVDTASTGVFPASASRIDRLVRIADDVPPGYEIPPWMCISVLMAPALEARGLRLRNLEAVEDWCGLRQEMRRWLLLCDRYEDGFLCARSLEDSLSVRPELLPLVLDMPVRGQAVFDAAQWGSATGPQRGEMALELVSSRSLYGTPKEKVIELFGNADDEWGDWVEYYIELPDDDSSYEPALCIRFSDGYGARSVKIVPRSQ